MVQFIFGVSSKACIGCVTKHSPVSRQYPSILAYQLGVVYDPLCEANLNMHAKACTNTMGTHPSTHACIGIHAYNNHKLPLTHISLHIHSLSHTHTHTQTHTHTHTLTHSHIHTQTNKHKHIHSHTRTLTHTRTHTHTYTHKHTHTRARALSLSLKHIVNYYKHT